jgi:alginate O-acetyltransferase complex protein AlgI
MLFNSLHFLVFFPIVVGLFFAIPYRFRWILLLIASYYFYMSWRAEYAIILVATTLIDYFSGYMMSKTEDKKKRRPYLYLSLISNLGTLFTFKYFNFFREAAISLGEQFNVSYAVPAFTLLLPVGVSFYTFQSVGYIIDVYYDKCKPEKNLGIFATFVAFFPQLVAGPIERAGHMLGQFYENHDFDYKRVTAGLKLMAWGLFKKVVIADRLAMMVNPVYNDPTHFEGFSLLLATVFFTFQIYCDFSGYSDMAIGSAQIMGFRLMENFRRPYFSKSIGEFWRRWHISLSSWFRDYLYIPLGGSRVVKWRAYYNLIIVFLVSGLWHGANWTFIIWGALHGFYSIFGMISKPARERLAAATGLTSLPTFHKFLNVGLTFCLVAFAWIFFRANSLQDALYISTHLFDGLSELDGAKLSQVLKRFSLHYRPELVLAVLCIVLLELAHLLQRRRDLWERLSEKPLLVRWAVYASFTLFILYFGIFNNTQFIYFQF